MAKFGFDKFKNIKNSLSKNVDDDESMIDDEYYNEEIEDDIEDDIEEDEE